MELGKYIKEKRKLFKLTQVELAERSGVGLRFVRELERGKATVQLNKVNQVLELFGESLYPTKINCVVFWLKKDKWFERIDISFLTPDLKANYKALITERVGKLIP